MISEECAVALVREKIIRAQALNAGAECLPGCKGWDVFEAHRQSGINFEVERCDACCFVADEHGNTNWFLALSDDEVELLPEAQVALKEAQKP